MNKNKLVTIIVYTISLLCIVSFLSTTCVVLYKVNNNKGIKYLNEIIESPSYKTGKDTYLLVKEISSKIATTGNNGYYVISDGEYNYVAYLSDKKAKELFKKDLESNPVKIYGKSKSTSNSLKELIVDYYNMSNDEDKKISKDDYYSYFGDVYLDQVNSK